MFDLKKIRRVHFIGIGGISLSSLALYMRARGVEVTGSDEIFADKFPLLAENGCKVWVGFRPENIGFPSLVVYSSAIKNYDPELVFCRNSGFLCMERFLFLGYLCSEFDYTVAVAGTHGKTTTTALLTHVFRRAKMKFYGHMGGDLKGVGNFFYSGDECFLTEACEYRKSLLSLKPSLGVVLNADADHPDTYKSLENLYDTFDAFMENTANGGIAVVDGDTRYAGLRQKHSGAIRYGESPGCDYLIRNVRELKNGCYGFSLSGFGSPNIDIRLNVPGRHNVKNTAAAMVICDLLKIDGETTRRAVADFPGVKRRFDKIGVFCGATVYSDYAHHPAEITTAIKTAREISDGKGVLAVFQPHTYSRTARLLNEFAESLLPCDELVVLKEYPARETPEDGASARDLFEIVPHPDKRYFDNIIDVARHLAENAPPKGIILILGAGDIANICPLLIDSPTERLGEPD